VFPSLSISYGAFLLINSTFLLNKQGLLDLIIHNSLQGIMSKKQFLLFGVFDLEEQRAEF